MFCTKQKGSYVNQVLKTPTVKQGFYTSEPHGVLAALTYDVILDSEHRACHLYPAHLSSELYFRKALLGMCPVACALVNAGLATSLAQAILGSPWEELGVQGAHLLCL